MTNWTLVRFNIVTTVPLLEYLGYQFLNLIFVKGGMLKWQIRI